MSDDEYFGAVSAEQVEFLLKACDARRTSDTQECAMIPTPFTSAQDARKLADWLERSCVYSHVGVGSCIAHSETVPCGYCKAALNHRALAERIEREEREKGHGDLSADVRARVEQRMTGLYQRAEEDGTEGYVASALEQQEEADDLRALLAAVAQRDALQREVEQQHEHIVSIVKATNKANGSLALDLNDIPMAVKTLRDRVTTAEREVETLKGQLSSLHTAPDFDGATYQRQHDHARLSGQLLRIYDVMKDGHWRTLEELAQQAQAPAASASAQLRNLRKRARGGYTIERRIRGTRGSGLYEYKLSL